MKGVTKATGPIVVLTLILGGAVGNAAATNGKSTRPAAHATRILGGKPAAPAAHPAARRSPTGYQVLTSGPLANDAGTASVGVVTCPAHTVVYGGGAFSSSGSTLVNLQGSYPPGNTRWVAIMSNQSSGNATFTVYAVCAKRTAKWGIIETLGVPNPPATQTTHITATCPATTKVLGGGGWGEGVFGQNLNSSFPVQSGSGSAAIYSWRVDMNNNSTLALHVAAYAVCGNAKGYGIYSSAPVGLPTGTQNVVLQNCPSPKVPLGGGIFSSSENLTVNINSTFPYATAWSGYENSFSGPNSKITGYVVCAD